MTRVQLTDAEWEFIGPYLPIGEYGPYPERLRLQFEGVIWRFETGGQWREMPREFGAWSTVHNRFRQWRDAGVFEALLEGLIAEAAKRGEVDLNLAHLRRRRIKAVIPEKEDQAANRKKKGSGGGRPVSHDAALYKRNTVERLINKLKARRGIATRYDKTPDSYLAGLHLRASMIWIKDLTRTTH